jgi:hypothetical protein
VSTFVVAEVTKNLTMASDPACLFVDTSTPEGRATGLVRNSVVSPTNASCFALIARVFDKNSTANYNKVDAQVVRAVTARLLSKTTVMTTLAPCAVEISVLTCSKEFAGP